MVRRIMTRADDLRDLEALHLMDNEGMSAREAAEQLGVTKNTVAGMQFRVQRDTDKVDASPHLNGTLEPRWWAE